MKHPSYLTSIIRHNDNIGPDYRFWSPSFNIHFGYWRWGGNPFDREAMLRQMNEEVLQKLQLPPGKPCLVLDAGCGTGATLRYIAGQLPAAKFCGVTLAPWLLNLGKKINEEAGLTGRIELLKADFQQMPLPGNTVDAAICIESVCYAEGKDKAALIREMARVLKPGGRLVVVDAFRKHNRPFPAFFEKLYRKNARLWAVDELAHLRLFEKTLAGAGFQNIEVEDISWRAAPTALHIPVVVLKLWWSRFHKGRRLRPPQKDYIKALLLTLLLGLWTKHLGYFMVSAKRNAP